MSYFADPTIDFWTALRLDAQAEREAQERRADRAFEEDKDRLRAAARQAHDDIDRKYFYALIDPGTREILPELAAAMVESQLMVARTREMQEAFERLGISMNIFSRSIANEGAVCW